MIWFVGQVFREYREYFETHNIPFGVLLDKDIGTVKEGVPTIPVDYSSPQTIIESLPKDTSKIKGLVTIYEAYVYPAVLIAKQLNLPTMSPESALACTDKVLMRQKFLDYNKNISPHYISVNSWADAEDFVKKHKFPLILKPANLAKSLLVTKNSSQEELRQNYNFAKKTMEQLYKNMHVNRKPKILLEEFLEGSVHSVDAFADSMGKMHVLENVVDYETGYDIGKNENYHFSRLLPSRLTKSEQENIRRVASEGMKALGMKNSPAHVEIIMTKSGPKIVEIGARTGGYRGRMHAYANNIDMYKALMNISLGKPIDIESKANNACAVLEIFPENEGKFIGITHFEDLEELKSLISLKVKPKVGEQTGRASKGIKAPLIVTLGSENHEELYKDYEFIKNNVEVKVSG